MRKISLKIGISILAFIIGIIATAIWFINSSSINQSFEVYPPPSIENETTEEYAVYSCVITDLFVKDRNSVNVLFIANQTSFYGNVEYLDGTTSEQRVQSMKHYYPSVSEETLLNFEAKQIKPIKVNPKLNLPVKYLLIDAKKLETAEGYASKSMIRISRIGFNKEKTQSFVYVEFFCGLCGGSHHLLLEKENGVWQIKEDFGGWVS